VRLGIRGDSFVFAGWLGSIVAFQECRKLVGLQPFLAPGARVPNFTGRSLAPG
jgi:hypothetical protein